MRDTAVAIVYERLRETALHCCIIIWDMQNFILVHEDVVIVSAVLYVITDVITVVLDDACIAGATVLLPTERSVMLWQKRVPEYQLESKVGDNLMALRGQVRHPCQSWGLLPLLTGITWVV